jgi:hypothetical protein
MGCCITTKDPEILTKTISSNLGTSMLWLKTENLLPSEILTHPGSQISLSPYRKPKVIRQTQPFSLSISPPRTLSIPARKFPSNHHVQIIAGAKLISMLEIRPKPITNHAPIKSRRPLIHTTNRRITSHLDQRPIHSKKHRLSLLPPIETFISKSQRQ